MLKTSLFIAAAFALSAQAAIAGPVGGSMTAPAASEKAGEKESSLISSAIKQMKFSLSAIRGTVGGSVGKSTEYKSTAPKQCDEAKKSTGEDEEAGKSEKAEPVGPEPIYFGF